MLPNAESCPSAPENLKWLLLLCRVLEEYQSVWEETSCIMLVPSWLLWCRISLCSTNYAITSYLHRTTAMWWFDANFGLFLHKGRLFVCLGSLACFCYLNLCIVRWPGIFLQFVTLQWTGTVVQGATLPSPGDGSSRPHNPECRAKRGFKMDQEFNYNLEWMMPLIIPHWGNLHYSSTVGRTQSPSRVVFFVVFTFFSSQQFEALCKENNIEKHWLWSSLARIGENSEPLGDVRERGVPGALSMMSPCLLCINPSQFFQLSQSWSTTTLCKQFVSQLAL